MSRQNLLLSILALMLLTGIVYSSAFHGEFIWDDDDHLTQNQAVAAPDGLSRIWSSLSVSRYYPLTLTTFWLQHRIWGITPLPYHVTTIAFHMFNAALLFLLLRRLNVRGAWVAAALWGIHPVNVESVAWVTEMKNTQSAFFFLLCLLGYVQFETTRKPGWYATALLLFIAALLSKPSTVFLPVALLLVVWWLHGRWQRADFLRVVPFVLFAIFMSILTIVEQQRLVQTEVGDEWTLHFVDRFVLAGRALWFYAIQLVWPFRVCFVYPRWTIDSHQLLAWVPLVAALAVTAVLWVQRRQNWARAALFGLGYFVLATGPVLGFLNIYYFRYSFVADHFNYLASMGFIALVVAGAATLLRQRPLQMTLAAICLAGFGWTAWAHTAVFRNDEALWTDTLRHNPDSVLACNNLGNIHQRRGELTQALPYLKQAVALNPDYPQVRNNLGTTLAQLNKSAEAEAEFKAALQIRPAYSDARFNLVRILEQQNKFDEAIVQLQTLAKEPAADISVFLELNELAVRQKDFKTALTALQAGHQSRPNDPRVMNKLAWALATTPEAEMRQPKEAFALATKLSQLTERKVPEVLDTLAACHAALGEFPQAVTVATEAADLADSLKRTDLSRSIRSRIDGYKNQRPAPPSSKAVPAPST